MLIFIEPGIDHSQQITEGLKTAIEKFENIKFNFQMMQSKFILEFEEQKTSILSQEIK